MIRLRRGICNERAGEIWRKMKIKVIIVWLVLTSLGQGDTFTSQVSGSSDDAKVYGQNMETSAANALIGYTGEYVCDYLARFLSVAVPQGATIDSAFAVLCCYSAGSGGVCNGVVYSEDTAQAAAFTSWSDYDARHLTDDSVSWDSLEAMVAGQWYRTPDISIPIEEVVARGDWTSGNSIALFFKDNSSSSGAFRRMYQYDGISSSACSLIVHFTVDSSAAGPAVRRRRVMVADPVPNEPTRYVHGGE